MESTQTGSGRDAGDQRKQGFIAYGKEQLSKQLGDASDFVRKAADGLDQNTGVCRIADRAVETMSSAAKYITTAEPRGVLRDANQFARRQPEMFLGGAFLGGLMLGRFLRSRPPETQGQSPETQGQSREGQTRMGYLGQMDDTVADTADEGQIEDTSEGEVTRGR